MKSSSFICALLFSIPAFGKLIYGTPECNTLVGTKKPKGRVPTITETVSTSYTVTQEITTEETLTFTPTVTATTTATSVVKTVTVRRNQRPTIFITKTISTTSTTASTITDTVISTVSTTITPPPDTTTISTPAGYSPIQSVDSHYLPKREAGLEPVLAKRAKPTQTCSVDSHGILHYYPPIYPTAVVCTKTAYSAVTTTVTVQGTDPVTTTYTPPATVTATVITSITSTITRWGVGRPKTVKVSITTTKVVSTTSTSTLSTTSTCTVVATPTPVVAYAMCSDDNIASHYQSGRNRRIIQNVFYDGDNRQRTFSNVTSATECCNKCAGDTGFTDTTNTFLRCAGSYWSLDGTCVLISDQGICNAKNVYFYTDVGSGADGQRFFVSNGPCGRGTAGRN